jgi:hypothetical protein
MLWSNAARCVDQDLNGKNIDKVGKELVGANGIASIHPSIRAALIPNSFVETYDTHLSRCRDATIFLSWIPYDGGSPFGGAIG